MMQPDTIIRQGLTYVWHAFRHGGEYTIAMDGSILLQNYTDEWRRFGWTSTRNIYTNDVHTIAASTLATSPISWRFAPNSTASLLAGL